MTSKFYKPKTTEEIIKAFKEYDVDNSGSLCVKEIEQVMRNFRGNFID
jgi:Ca2+-binding EF-hand superfamily protein